jgi:hypothetical protein
VRKLWFKRINVLTDIQALYALEERLFPHWGSPTEGLLRAFYVLYHVR